MPPGRHARGENQKVSQTLASIWLTLASNPELVGMLLRGIDDFDSLNRIDKARFRFAQMSYMRVHECAWFQHEIGILREEDWKAVLGDMESYLFQTGMQKAWPLVRNRSGESFRKYVDATISELRAGSETQGRRPVRGGPGAGFAK